MSLDPKKADRLARLALKRARAHFLVDPTWRISIKGTHLEAGTTGELTSMVAYRRGQISYDPGQMESPAELWGTIGHEVAHIALAQFDAFRNVLEEAGRWDGTLESIWLHGLENSVMTLQAMWERDCPMPKDAWK